MTLLRLIERHKPTLLLDERRQKMAEQGVSRGAECYGSRRK